MQLTFLKRAIKNSLAKVGVSVTRLNHGDVIYRTEIEKRSILHSALTNVDSFVQEKYSVSRHTNLVVNQTSLRITDPNGRNRAQASDHFSVTLSGIAIQPGSDTTWHWPDTLKNGVRTLEITFKDPSGQESSDSYLIDFRRDNQRLFGALYSGLITEPVMGIFMIGFRNNHCFTQGWIYDPNHQPTEQHFNLNGEVPKVRFSKNQPEWEIHIGPVFSYFTMKGDKHFSFFEAELETPCQTDKPVVLSYQSKPPATLNRCQEAYIEDGLPIPDGDIFKRVSGDQNPFTFRYVGYSTFLKLEALCEKYLARNFGQLDRVLDWGCGCGRVTRYFTKYKLNTEIHGIDIDKIGITWLKENLDFGNFAHIQPNTKTPFPDEHFDFIFGISIFTHLTEEEHFFWLGELQRLIAKNGIVAVTIGNTIMRARTFNVNIEDQVSDHLSGYTDQGHNTQINGAIDNGEYYRNAYITKDYIQTVWSEYFDILYIHSGLISCLQDMVIMRKKN